jgi:hypothetical protein
MDQFGSCPLFGTFVYNRFAGHTKNEEKNKKDMRQKSKAQPRWRSWWWSLANLTFGKLMYKKRTGEDTLLAYKPAGVLVGIATPSEVNDAITPPIPSVPEARTPAATDETAELPPLRPPMILVRPLGRSLLENGHGNVADSLSVGEMLIPITLTLTVTL